MDLRNDPIGPALPAGIVPPEDPAAAGATGPADDAGGAAFEAALARAVEGLAGRQGLAAARLPVEAGAEAPAPAGMDAGADPRRGAAPGEGGGVEPEAPGVPGEAAGPGLTPGPTVMLSGLVSGEGLALARAALPALDAMQAGRPVIMASTSRAAMTAMAPESMTSRAEPAGGFPPEGPTATGATSGVGDADGAASGAALAPTADEPAGGQGLAAVRLPVSLPPAPVPGARGEAAIPGEARLPAEAGAEAPAPAVPLPRLDARQAGLPVIMPSATRPAVTAKAPAPMAGPTAEAMADLPVAPPGSVVRLTADGLPLREVSLGEGMRLITPASPDPDAASLVRFARAHGFDEAAVRQIFGAEALPTDAPPARVAPAAWVLPAAAMASTATTAAAPAEPAVSAAWALAARSVTLAMAPVRTAVAGAAGEPLVEAGAATPAADPGAGLDVAPEAPPVFGLRLPELLRGEAMQTAPTPLGDVPGAEAFEAAARRLADAVSQRIVAELRRGSWEVAFALDPPELGRVEVSLQMRAGELEARFTAHHGLTRELLQEALPRLRDGLQQAGMDVAQLQVGLGLQARSGGNPTPGWSPAAPGGSGDQADAQADAVAPPGAREAGHEAGTVDTWA